MSIGDEVAILEILQYLEGSKEVFLHVKIMKDEGNYIFNQVNVQVNVQGALECYEKAIKLLTYIFPFGRMSFVRW